MNVKEKNEKMQMFFNGCMRRSELKNEEYVENGDENSNAVKEIEEAAIVIKVTPVKLIFSRLHKDYFLLKNLVQRGFAESTRIDIVYKLLTDIAVWCGIFAITITKDNSSVREEQEFKLMGK